MHRHLIIFSFFLLLVSSQSSTYLHCGSLFDPISGKVTEDQIVEVRHSLVVNITDFTTFFSENPSPENVIDLSRYFVLPGLIDAHVHLFLRTYEKYDWDMQVIQENPFERILRAGQFAAKTLMAGFTSVRDLGTEGAGDADLSLKNCINNGDIIGPRLFISSRAIVSTGGYPPKGYNAEFYGGEVADGVEEMRKVVRRQLNIGGADWIKLYGDYSRYQGRNYPLFSQAEIEAAVEEAAEVGAHVAVHAKGPEAILRAVRAGAKSIEHASLATDEALIGMEEAGVSLVPTLAISEALASYFPDDEGRQESFENCKAMFKRALELGVPIVCGSDAGGFPNGENVRELELMTELGMSNLYALQSATSLAGALLQGTSFPTIGVINMGSFADIIAVEGNPLTSISDLRNLRFIMKDGQIHLNE